MVHLIGGWTFVFLHKIVADGTAHESDYCHHYDDPNEDPYCVVFEVHLVSSIVVVDRGEEGFIDVVLYENGDETLFVIVHQKCFG